MPHISKLQPSSISLILHINMCIPPPFSNKWGEKKKKQGLNDDWSLADKRKGFKGPRRSMLGWVQSYQVLGKRNVFPHLIELKPFFTKSKINRRLFFPI